MKIITNLFILLLVSIAVLSSCKMQKHTTWEHNVKIGNIEFEKARYLLDDNSDTTGSECFLKTNSIIQGFPCSTELIELNIDGKLLNFHFSKDFEMSGNVISKGTFIRVYNDKLICMFPKNTIIQGYLCRGNLNKMGTEGIHTTLYLNGRLRHFFPKKNVLINDIYCMSSIFTGILLYEDGKLKECKLAKDQTINGVYYKKGTKLSQNEDGKIIHNS